MKAAISALFLALASTALAADCPSYLAPGVAVERIETLLGRNVRILDASAGVRERVAKSDPRLKVFDLSSVFAEGKVFMGFGKPNVYLGIPGEATAKGPGFSKFAAKSLKRGDSELIDTHGIAQSGILVVFKDLSPEVVERITARAKAHEGTRRWTCVNANCRVLSEAGFTVGAETPEQYYFPIPLLRDILRYGIQVDGKPVEFDVIRTNADYLEDVQLSIEKSVWTTLCRHAERACQPKKDSHPLIVKIKNGASNLLGMFIGSVGKAPLVESKQTRLDDTGAELNAFDVEVSEPSRFGTLLGLLWGPHSLFEIPLNKADVDALLPDKLKSFPQTNPTLVTRIKKNFLFSKPVVSLIRSQIAPDYSRFKGVNEKNLFDMLRTDSVEHPNRYNFVLTGDRLIIMKISIKMKYVDWILSKHVLMADYSKDVRFAGEFWKGEDGKLHFSPNSGTYQPKNELLPQMAEILKRAFPNLPTVMEKQ